MDEVSDYMTVEAFTYEIDWFTSETDSYVVSHPVAFRSCKESDIDHIVDPYFKNNYGKS